MEREKLLPLVGQKDVILVAAGSTIKTKKVMDIGQEYLFYHSHPTDPPGIRCAALHTISKAQWTEQVDHEIKDEVHATAKVEPKRG